jgi:hypothetical protein
MDDKPAARRKIGGFLEESQMLAPLESFPPEAFRGDDKVPQDLCSFVLALALIYNDCKDALYTHVAIAEQTPAGPPQKSRAWGGLAGSQLHAFRVVAGLLHELFKLIQENEQILEHDFFAALVRRLPRPSRRAWTTLVEVARGATPTDELGKRLLLIRHKVFFHYDLKAIFRGYSRYFLDAGRVDSRAYVSRGGSMRATRFFFADAAAEGYIHHVSGTAALAEVAEDLAEIVDSINNGLMTIVGRFIQARGFAFRQEVEG